MSEFRKIYESYSKPVYRFLLSLTRNETMAEDLLQEVFYKALLHIDRFEGKSSLYTWLCQIGKNAWLKECTKHKKHIMYPIEEVAVMADSQPTPEEQAIAREEHILVRKAVLRLSDPYKDVFLLHTYGDIKLKEIAELYEKSETWARVTYYRAKQQIIQEVLK